MSQPRWTRLSDIRRQLEKRWQKGELLRAGEQPDEVFPLRLTLKKPTASGLLEHFHDARRWATHWQGATSQNLVPEWRTVNHRQLGRNTLPVAVVIPTLDAALRQIGRQDDARRYHTLAAEITRRFPVLTHWCRRKPLKVLALQAQWPALLATLAWMAQHPRPGLYIRQLEIPSVHTKFIESHRGLLGELLDQILPEEAIDRDATGVGHFEQRYGFRRRPSRLRLRILDSAHRLAGLDDIELPVEQFAALRLPLSTVYIVENDITALAFPPTPSAMVIFGQGYGIGRQLADAHWLKDKKVLYWGDIDTHGLRILSQLRDTLPHSRSLLMDAVTLKDHSHLWGTEPSPYIGELPNLTDDEQDVYRLLGTLEPDRHLRLEQEHIKFSAL